MRQYKNIVVLGAAYGGQAAAKILAEGVSKLSGNWRVVVIDRNTHFNHVYAFPRFSVVPGHEFKAFIRYDGTMPCDKPGGLLPLTASILSLSAHSVTLDRAFPEHGFPTPEIPFEYAIYALGGSLPAPVNLWGPRLDAQLQADPKAAGILGSKPNGMEWLQCAQGVIGKARSVLVVGGGALGIQLATDIADVHPKKRVTLVHSRGRFMPRFSQEMHDEIIRQLDHLNVNVHLNERIDLKSAAERKTNDKGERVVLTESGKELAADLILMCTGQKPNTEVLTTLDPSLLAPNGRARVTRTLQLGSPESTKLDASASPAPHVDTPASLASQLDALQLDSQQPASPASPAYPQIFAAGDCADAFNALCAGHNAYYQGQLAARNVLRLARNEEKPDDEKEELEKYEPLPPAIKVSLGLNRGVMQSGNDPIVISEKGYIDLQCALMWEFHGHKITCDDDMRD
ncbi:hypothetical protein EV121DRAFT_264853 [Schizophyllum commune]